MAKKKPRPGFNLPSTESSGAPASSAWVYRSDDPPSSPAEPERATVSRSRRAKTSTQAASSAPARGDGARGIVGNYAMLAAGAGLVPVPALDVLAIGGLQLKMIAALADHYGLPFSHDRGKAIVSALAGGVFSTRLAYGVGGSLLKVIPLVGPWAGSYAMSGFGAAFTWAVGSVFVQHFETGGTLLTFDAAKMRAHFDREFAEQRA